MSDGCLVDIGSPFDLLQDPKTILYKLVKKLNREEAKYLCEIAQYHVKMNIMRKSYIV